MIVKKAEIVAPAGNLEKLKYAYAYGADAAYIGWKKFSLRNMADNFSFEDILRAVELKRDLGKKLYLTLNIYPRNEIVEEIRSFIADLKNVELDGVIVSDPGIINLCRELIPHIPLHISTQANTLNYMAVDFYKNLGARRAVVARELTIKEIGEIKNIHRNFEIEMFVHGALCLSYSGRCNLSLYLTGRDANLGECTHSCRWKYYLMEEKREGEFFPVETDSYNNLYILNPRDLCLLFFLPDIEEANVDALKIEGRMKGIFYVATVVKAYRKALDFWYEVKDRKKYFDYAAFLFRNMLKSIQNRKYTFDFAGKSSDANLKERVSEIFEEKAEKIDKFAGLLKTVDAQESVVKVFFKNKLSKGDILYYRSPDVERGPFVVENIFDENGNAVPFGIANQEYFLKFNSVEGIDGSNFGVFYF